MNKSIDKRKIILDNCAVLSDFRVLGNDASDFLLGLADFLEKCARRYAQRTVSENNQLLQTVRGDNAHTVLLRKLMRHLFNIHIRSLRFFGINNTDAVDALDLTLIALNLVGVKYQNQLTFFPALIVAKNVNKGISCGFKIIHSNFFALKQQKNDVVTVHKQIFF